jgi:DNA-directed RNA polymerase subunit M
MFCPKCGALLKIRQEGSKNIMYCGCGYSSKETEKLELKESVKTEVEKIDIVGNEEDALLPEIDAECPKCKHQKAVFWMVQTRAGDEAETRFFRCKNCGHTWREYK